MPRESSKIRGIAHEATIKAEETLLKSISVKCIECDGKMIRVRDLYDSTVVGYSCEDCTHYYLFDNNPV